MADWGYRSLSPPLVSFSHSLSLLFSLLLPFSIKYVFSKAHSCIMAIYPLPVSLSLSLSLLFSSISCIQILVPHNQLSYANTVSRTLSLTHTRSLSLSHPHTHAHTRSVVAFLVTSKFHRRSFEPRPNPRRTTFQVLASKGAGCDGPAFPGLSIPPPVGLRRRLSISCFHSSAFPSKWKQIPLPLPSPITFPPLSPLSSSCFLSLSLSLCHFTHSRFPASPSHTHALPP